MNNSIILITFLVFIGSVLLIVLMSKRTEKRNALPIPESAPEASPVTASKTSAYQVRYSYEGPQDINNRPFCAKMLELNRLYSRKDIEDISERLGYSVWDRCGGDGCRHKWVSKLTEV